MAKQPSTETVEADEKKLWQKLRKLGSSASQEVIEKVLWLYYATKQEGTPAWAKGAVYSALAYFILPFDAIPDFIPITGYSDDLLTLTAAVTTIAFYINDEVKVKAQQKLDSWFS